jgi:hypothetical protein
MPRPTRTLVVSEDQRRQIKQWLAALGAVGAVIVDHQMERGVARKLAVEMPRQNLQELLVSDTGPDDS